MWVTFLGLRKQFVITFVLQRNNLILYYMIVGSFEFVSTRSTISLWSSFVYMIESPIWKCEFVVLDCVDTLQTLFGGFNRVLYNLCDTTPQTSSSSTSVVKCIVLTVIVYSFVLMDVKEKFNIEYLDVDLANLKNLANFLNPDCISSSGRQCSE